jgi:DNA invertase Pin-like site-specific DNA recombinase
MYFENENLNSIGDEAEFAITLSGILAQEESRNLSENIQWGYQRKFENGDIFTKYKNFMGYKCENDNLAIVSKQAEVVKTIFKLYIRRNDITADKRAFRKSENQNCYW